MNAYTADKPCKIQCLPPAVTDRNLYAGEDKAAASVMHKKLLEVRLSYTQLEQQHSVLLYVFCARNSINTDDPIYENLSNSFLQKKKKKKSSNFNDN